MAKIRIGTELLQSDAARMGSKSWLLSFWGSRISLWRGVLFQESSLSAASRVGCHACEPVREVPGNFYRGWPVPRQAIALWNQLIYIFPILGFIPAKKITNKIEKAIKKNCFRTESIAKHSFCAKKFNI